MDKKDAGEEIAGKEVTAVIQEKYWEIFAAEKKVADFIMQNPHKAVDFNVSELAKQSGVSDATVIRMCHHLGYAGYYQFRIALARDLGKQQYGNDIPSEGKDAVETRFQEYAEAMLLLGRNIKSDVMCNCVNLIKTCKYAHIIAVGNTSPLAQYMGFRLGRLGIKCTYHPAPEYFLNHINLAAPEDILIAITRSGMSKQIIQGLQLGKEKGLKSIAITSCTGSPASELADYTLLSCGKAEHFSYYKDYTRLNEIAVIDALLSFVANEELIKTTQSDKLEIMLSESKL